METARCSAVDHCRKSEEEWRRRCGCLRTSDKLKQMLDCFPPPPPPTPTYPASTNPEGHTCISAYCTVNQPTLPNKVVRISNKLAEIPLADTEVSEKINGKSWRVAGELVQLLQLSVTATALALYYLIYCYMQLVYYTLRSALYFHNADGPMKITIGVVTITSLIVAFNLILRLERLVGVFH